MVKIELYNCWMTKSDLEFVLKMKANIMVFAFIIEFGNIFVVIFFNNWCKL
jgi:hypothetical protein